MQVSVESETFDMLGYAIDDTSQYTGKNAVPFVDSAAAWDKENERLTVFVINRSETEEYPLTVDMRGFEGYSKISHEEMYSKDFELKSRFGADWKAPEVNKSAKVEGGLATTKLQPLSWNVITFTK